MAEIRRNRFEPTEPFVPISLDPSDNYVKHPYPDDADGDALRKVAESGADMSRAMVIEFSVDVPDERAARKVAEVVTPVGFDPSIFHHHETDSWSVYCAKEMLATYEAVIGVESELNRLLQPHGGHCDGWGTFGNTQEET